MLRTPALILILAGAASAHVPTFADAGSSPDSAFLVANPDQSRVFYGELDAGTQHWFQFERVEGESIHVSVHLPAGEAERPKLWIVGPGIAGEGPRQTPANLGGAPGSLLDDLSIEPFTPLAMREVSAWSEPAPASGTYFIVIEADAAATYSIGLGLGESFSVAEWAIIPVQRISIMSWANIGWPLALAGEFVAIVAVITIAWKRRLPIQNGLGFVAAGIMAGTGLTTLLLALVATVQAGPSGALLVPIVFAGLAGGIGYGSYRAIVQVKPWQALGWAVAGLAAWAGLLIGSAALAAWAVWKLTAKSEPPQTNLE